MASWVGQMFTCTMYILVGVLKMLACLAILPPLLLVSFFALLPCSTLPVPFQRRLLAIFLVGLRDLLQNKSQQDLAHGVGL